MLFPVSLSRILCFLAALILSVLAGCGGGGSSNTASSSVAGLPPSLASKEDSNVALVNVERGPGGNVNMPYVTVTVCIPGYNDSNRCKSIDHVLLDTGSTGLRIFTSTVGTLALPPHTIGASSSISECANFLNTKAWGSIRVADVIIGKEKASALPVQVMDTNPPSNTCSGAPLMSPPGDNATGRAPLSANGILGVGLFAYDQQSYFDCANVATGCSRIYPQANQQVQNPVTQFSSGNNNGVVVQLPALDATGNPGANGYLIFGIGTQPNNSLGNAVIVPANAAGRFTTRYKGQNLTASFIDSGSNGLYFNDADIAACTSPTDPGFYCPPSTLSLAATIGSVTVNFSIANASSLFRANNYAFNNLGGSLDNNTFDWGLPFFFGRTVYNVVEGKTVGTQTGPFYAFTN